MEVFGTTKCLKVLCFYYNSDLTNERHIIDINDSTIGIKMSITIYNKNVVRYKKSKNKTICGTNVPWLLCKFV